jgi:hypothetical protein
MRHLREQKLVRIDIAENHLLSALVIRLVKSLGRVLGERPDAAHQVYTPGASSWIVIKR